MPNDIDVPANDPWIYMQSVIAHYNVDINQGLFSNAFVYVNKSRALYKNVVKRNNTLPEKEKVCLYTHPIHNAIAKTNLAGAYFCINPISTQIGILA